MNKCVKCKKMFSCKIATDYMVNCDKFERQPNRSEIEAMSKPYELEQAEILRKSNIKIGE